MACLRQISKNILCNISKFENKLQHLKTCSVCARSLSYTTKEYDAKRNPAPLFLNKDVQNYLKTLTRIDIAKVYKKQKLGEKRLELPVYKFMTDEELQVEMKKSIKKTEELLQMPPIVATSAPAQKVISKDPALTGLDDSCFVFTDITYGLRDSDRLIVKRDTEGTLQEADWELRKRMNQIYFPHPHRSLKTPKMFNDEYLSDVLDRREYLFILDRACFQFEPNDPEYQRVVSITYQHLNDNNEFDKLRSTRHFGNLAFFLAWHKNIDNLLLDLIETANETEAVALVKLYAKLNSLTLKNDHFDVVEEYIKNYANNKAALELATQAYREVAKENAKLESGIKAAHGF